MPDRSPQRSCFGCGRKRPKSELLRLAVARDGRVGLDIKQTAEGRGVYVCPRPECLERAAKRRPPRTITRRTTSAALAEALGRAGERLAV